MIEEEKEDVGKGCIHGTNDAFAEEDAQETTSDQWGGNKIEPASIGEKNYWPNLAENCVNLEKKQIQFKVQKWSIFRLLIEMKKQEKEGLSLNDRG